MGKTEIQQAARKTVLVGTYRGGQLDDWPGYYNYPLSKNDKIDVEGAKRVNELWLFQGAKEGRFFSAEYVGRFTREELKEKFAYPARGGKAHGDTYLLYRITETDIYDPASGLADAVIVRAGDFATAPKVRKQVKAYLESPERQDPALATLVPEILTQVPHEALRVCEGAVQMFFPIFADGTSHLEPVLTVSKWDKSIESEKSSYAWSKDPVYFERLAPVKPGKLNVVELFCGCGGTSLGFEMAGYQTVFGVDFLEPAIETFRNNHKTASAILGDIKRITAEDIVKHVPCKIDVVIAGVPCQGFSLNNRKRHDDDHRNFLYLELIRILRTIKPRAVVVENVSGIRSSSNGQVPAEIEKGIFEACGLTVKHQLLHAMDYGVPQRRARVVFVGVENKGGFDFSKLKKTNGPGTGRPYTSVRDAIGDLPPLASGELATRYSGNPQCEYQKLMRNGAVTLANHEAPTHPQETIDKIAFTKPGEPMYPKFHQRIRLSWDDQSPTQVSGGIRPQFQFGHPSQPRGLTIRERCRIQSFPDSFVVSGGLVQGRVQTGNAVPPLLAKAVGEALREYL